MSDPESRESRARHGAALDAAAPNQSRTQLRGSSAADEIELGEIWGVLWRGRAAIVGVTAIVTVAAIAYAFLATPWYRSEVLLAPSEERVEGPLAGQLGGLAALAGVSMGGGGAVAESVAVLESRAFASAFVEDFQLLSIFFSDEWDAGNGRWRDEDPAEWPDVRDAVDFFHEEVLRVSIDGDTSMVTLAIEWTDPEVAATWADALVRRLNARMRDRALREAQANVAYLQAELAGTSVVTLQQSIGRLLEAELQKLMLARGSEEFAFRVIDPARPPKYQSRPNRVLVVLIGGGTGAILAVLGVLLAHALREPGRR